jgi:hypothetical protein
VDGQRINIRAVLVVGANRYSRNNEGSRSCASCHNPGLSWADGQPRAVGLTQELLTLRCPTLLGVAWIPRPGWTGRFRDLESVAMTPITSPLRVKSRHAALKRRCPLYPQKRTLVSATGMSALCQKQAQQSAPIRSPRRRWRVPSRYVLGVARCSPGASGYSARPQEEGAVIAKSNVPPIANFIDGIQRRTERYDSRLQRSRQSGRQRSGGMQ